MRRIRSRVKVFCLLWNAKIDILANTDDLARRATLGLESQSAQCLGHSRIEHGSGGLIDLARDDVHADNFARGAVHRKRGDQSPLEPGIVSRIGIMNFGWHFARFAQFRGQFSARIATFRVLRSHRHIAIAVAEVEIDANLLRCHRPICIPHR
jgi:hypothetical protein